MQALRALKGILWFIAVYQFVVGTLLLLTPSLAQIVVGIYGSNMQVTEQFTFILKPLGAYMIMTGLIASAVARADMPHPSIVLALVVLFGINVLYRVMRFEYVQTTFGIPAWHLIGQMVFLSALGISLAVLSRAAMKATGATAGDRSVSA
jgi:hypothetical protein